MTYGWDPRILKALEVEYTNHNTRFDMYLYDLIPPRLRRCCSFSANGFGMQVTLRTATKFPLDMALQRFEMGLPLSPGSPSVEEFRDNLTSPPRKRILRVKL